MTLHRLVAAAFVGASICTTSIAAQQPAVPRDLAEAFVRLNTPGDSTAMVDFVPALVPQGLQPAVHLPPDAKILGTVIVGPASYVFATIDVPTDSALALTQREYGRARWAGSATIQLAQGANPAVGGFRPAPPRIITNFCSDSVSVNVAAARIGDSRSTLRLRFGRATRCSAAGGVMRLPPGAVVGPAGTLPPEPGLPLPRLIDPPNTAASAACYPPSGLSTTTRLATPMTPAELVEHYGKQLEAQGWTITTDGAMARRSWTRRDPAGNTEVATLTIGVSPTAPACRSASIEVATLRIP